MGPPEVNMEVDPPEVNTEVDPLEVNMEVDPPEVNTEVDPPKWMQKRWWKRTSWEVLRGKREVCLRKKASLLWMGTILNGSFYNAAICCKQYISIRGHNKQPHKWPVQNEGEIWSWFSLWTINYKWGGLLDPLLLLTLIFF